MIKYFTYIDNQKVLTVSEKLSCSPYDELLKLNDKYTIIYNIKISEEQNLSVRQLRLRIKSKEYERLDSDTKSKLINKEENTVVDFVKNSILIKNSYNYIDLLLYNIKFKFYVVIELKVRK